MIVNGDRQNALSVELADDVAIEDAADLLRSRNAIARFDEGVLVLLANDVHAQLDAFIADEHGRTGD